MTSSAKELALARKAKALALHNKVRPPSRIVAKHVPCETMNDRVQRSNALELLDGVPVCNHNIAELAKAPALGRLSQGTNNVCARIVNAAGTGLRHLFLVPQVSELEAALAAATAGAPCEPVHTDADRPVTDSAAAGGVSGSLAAETVDEARTANGAVAPADTPRSQPVRAPRADTSVPQPQDAQPSLLDIMDTAWHAKPPQTQARRSQCGQTRNCSDVVSCSTLYSSWTHICSMSVFTLSAEQYQAKCFKCSRLLVLIVQIRCQD